MNDSIQDHIQAIDSLSSNNNSIEDIPIITPCLNSINDQKYSSDFYLDSLAKNLPFIKIYSDTDGTFVNFYLENKNISIKNLKDHLNLLKIRNRTHYPSFDSQASTVDSHNLIKAEDISFLDNEIKVYCFILPNLKKEFPEDMKLLSILSDYPETKFYYSFSNNFKNISENELIVLLYPKMNILDFNVKCTIKIIESGLIFSPIKNNRISGNTIFIGINDIASIISCKQIKNCLLIKRKNITKNSILFSTKSDSEFFIIKEKLKEIYEILNDSRLISEADNMISAQSKNINSIEKIVELNKLTNFYEFYNSNLQVNLFEHFSNNKNVINKFNAKVLNKKLESESQNILTLEQLKLSLMNQERVSLDLKLDDLKVFLERNLEGISLSIEDFLQVN